MCVSQIIKIKGNEKQTVCSEEKKNGCAKVKMLTNVMIGLLNFDHYKRKKHKRETGKVNGKYKRIGDFSWIFLCTSGTIRGNVIHCGIE